MWQLYSCTYRFVLLYLILLKAIQFGVKNNNPGQSERENKRFVDGEAVM